MYVLYLWKGVERTIVYITYKTVPVGSILDFYFFVIWCYSYIREYVIPERCKPTRLLLCILYGDNKIHVLLLHDTNIPDTRSECSAYLVRGNNALDLNNVRIRKHIVIRVLRSNLTLYVAISTY